MGERPLRHGRAGVALVAAALVLAGCVSVSGAPSPALTPGGATDGAAPTTPPSSAPRPTPAASALPSPTSSALPSRTPRRSHEPSQPSASAGGPAPTLAAGRVEVPELGFAITLAEGWSSIPLDPDDLDAVFSMFPPDSDMGRLLSGQVGDLIKAGVKLWAFDLRPASIVDGFAPNLNVLGGDPTGLPMSVVAASGAAQLKAISGITNVASGTVELPVGESARVTYDLEVTTTAQDVAASGIQYYVETGSHLLVLTFSCATADPGTCPGEVDAMMQSLELLGPDAVGRLGLVGQAVREL